MRHLVVNLFDDNPQGSFARIKEIQDTARNYDCNVDIFVSTDQRYLLDLYSENPHVRVTRYERMPLEPPRLDLPQPDDAVEQLMKVSYGYWVNSIGITRALIGGAKYQIAFTSVASQLDLSGLETLIENEIETNFIYVNGLKTTYPYYMLPTHYNWFSDPATSIKLGHFWSHLQHWDLHKHGWEFFLKRFQGYDIPDSQIGAYLWYAWCANQAVKLRRTPENPDKAKARLQQLFHGAYDGWRSTRINKLIELLGKDWFQGKKILELGAGHGHIGADLAKLGATVTCAEGRAEHVELIQQNYPQVRAIQLDQDKQWNLKEKFDLIIHWGVLYHLDNWQRDLKCALKHSGLVALETEVADSDDPNFQIKIRERGFDQALNDIGSRPSPAFIEAELTGLGATFERYDDTMLNHDVHRYDWEIKNTGTWDFGQRKFWMVRK